MKRAIVCFVLLNALFTVTPVHANERVAVAAPAQNCHMEENNTLSFSMNGSEKDITKIKALMDAKMAEVKAVATEASVTDFEVQNYSYNTYSNNNGGCSNGVSGDLQYNANFSFLVKPADKAAELAASLGAKGYNVSLNVNAYRQCQ